MKGIVASTAGLSILLDEGIGDTIRVSLTPAPGGDRTEEVLVAQQVLQSLGLRSFLPQVSACPGCGRTTSTFFQEMAQRIQAYLREQMPGWAERYPGVEEMRVAVMGCVVNGPASRSTPTSASPCRARSRSRSRPVFVDGALRTTLRGEGLVDEFIAILDDYVTTRYGARQPRLAEDRRTRHRSGRTPVAVDSRLRPAGASAPCRAAGSRSPGRRATREPPVSFPGTS